MAGAAVIVGVLKAIAAMSLPINVNGVSVSGIIFVLPMRY